MASISTPSASGTRPVALPIIPELFNNNYLDVLIPATPDNVEVMVEETPRNPMMDALKAVANQTHTDKGAPAFSSTLSATLDAFTGISRSTFAPEMETYLSNSWNEDPSLTLRIIWNLRSICDGKGEKEAFYRAFGWLYDNHPRTAISNLRVLVKPQGVSKKQKAHGYWKDLLNILALATVDELSRTTQESTFLHAPRTPAGYGGRKRKTRFDKGTSESRIADAQLWNERKKAEAAALRRAKRLTEHRRLVEKLSEPKFSALYIAVARLFAEQLIDDMDILSQIEDPQFTGDSIALSKEISLAGKWAPTPNHSHDRVTNISTAIAEVMYSSRTLAQPYPSALNYPLPAEERASILRSYLQRHILTPLRAISACPEPLMSSGRWKEISYSRVPSISMKINTPHFFKHDPEGFAAYLMSVENNKKSISGATLLPHELVAQVVTFHDNAVYDDDFNKPDPKKDFKKDLARVQLRVVESQWKTLIASLRESGSIENSLAICDVSGSMGSLFGNYHNMKHVQPILPAVSLSLLLATLAKPPFHGGFITFSASPQFIQLDLSKSLEEQILNMNSSHWEMNTNLQSVFMHLLLPLAIKNKVKQEDMIKRLFIFSDMQFDHCHSNAHALQWETNYDKIEQAYKKAGYEVPQIVFWNLAAEGETTTFEVESDRKGVAMMNGFSPAMLKVFMGDLEEDTEVAPVEDMEWENVDGEGNSVTVVENVDSVYDFNPINVMKKALARSSFDGLVVVDYLESFLSLALLGRILE